VRKVKDGGGKGNDLRHSQRREGKGHLRLIDSKKRKERRKGRVALEGKKERQPSISFLKDDDTKGRGLRQGEKEGGSLPKQRRPGAGEKGGLHNRLFCLPRQRKGGGSRSSFSSGKSDYLKKKGNTSPPVSEAR